MRRRRPRLYVGLAAFCFAPSLLLAGCVSGSSGPATSEDPIPDLEAPPPAQTTVESPGHRVVIDSARVLLRQVAAEGVGLAVGVARDGELVWLEGAGWADPGSGEPVDPGRTRFRIYSVTKPMTAVVAARLMERGRLDPSAPVQRYVPTFPGPRNPDNPITPMHLATHRSGIRHYADDAEASSQRHCSTVEDALAVFRDDPLLHPPGQAETYSSWGYVLLSAVLEGATGSSYSGAMEEWLFEPTGMSRTVVDDPDEPIADRAEFFRETTDGVDPAPPVDNTCKWGAGAYLSTAEDVARFGAAMLNSEFLSPRSLELFMQGEDVYRAQGVGTGGAAFLVVDREGSLSVTLLSNTVGEGTGPAAQEAAARIHELFREAP